MSSTVSPLRLRCLTNVRFKANSDAGAAILKGLDVVLQDLDVLIGLTCSPISVVGVGSGSECSGTTVSCSNGLFVSLPPLSARSETDTVLCRAPSASAASPSPSEP